MDDDMNQKPIWVKPTLEALAIAGFICIGLAVFFLFTLQIKHVIFWGFIWSWCAGLFFGIKKTYG